MKQNSNENMKKNSNRNMNLNINMRGVLENKQGQRCLQHIQKMN